MMGYNNGCIATKMVGSNSLLVFVEIVVEHGLYCYY